MNAALTSFALARAQGVLPATVQTTTPMGGVWLWVYLPCNKDGFEVAVNSIRPTNQVCGVLSWSSQVESFNLAGQVSNDRII